MNNYTTKIFKLMVLLQPLLLYATVFKVMIFVQLISEFILIGSFLQLFLTAWNNRAANNKSIFSLAIVIMLIAFISLYWGGFTYDGFIAYLMFVSMLATWIVYPHIEINAMNSVMKYSFLLQAMLLIYFSRQSFAYDMHIEDMIATQESLTLGFNNPNLASMIIFYVFVGNLIYYKCERRFWAKALYIFLLTTLFYHIVETDCRTTLLLTAFVVISFFLTNKIRTIGKIMIKKIVPIGTLAFPILFCLVYVYLSFSPELRDMELFGKPLFSGREVLFVDFYNSFSDSPLIGLCGKYKFANAHNGMLTILLNTGFVGIFFYIIYIYKNLRNISNSIINIANALPLIAIIAVFIISSSEAAMLVAGNLFYVYFLTLLAFVKRESYNNKF